MKLLKDMDEPELRLFFNEIIGVLQSCLPDDIEGFMLVVATDEKICQYAGTLERTGAIDFLRETADRLEAGNTIER